MNLAALYVTPSNARENDAISCDLLPTERRGPHVQGDVLPLLRGERWDLVTAHPPCTYLCKSGDRWLPERPERWGQLEKSAEFFRNFLNANAPHIAIENPTPHKYATDSIGSKPSSAVLPYEFGHQESITVLFLDMQASPTHANCDHAEEKIRRCLT